MIKVDRIPVNCNFCGANLLILPCHAKLRNHHYCGKNCQNRWHGENTKGELHPNWKGGPNKVKCSQCEKIIYRSKAETKEHKNHFCSKECDGKWRSENRRGAIIYNWKEPIKVSCDQCGKEILKSESRSKLYEHNFCSRLCQGMWHSENLCKEKSYQWRGGIYALRERLRNDPRTSINARMAAGISISLKGNKKGRSWEKLVGYSCEQLMNHLKKTLPTGYTWNDFLKSDLEIDHIIPQTVFNFTSEKDIDFQKCWALNNLQLLPERKNRQKGARMQTQFQPSLALEVRI